MGEHNPWDAACTRNLPGEPTHGDARCPVCRPRGGVWVVAAACGDYYCGCGLGHLLGITADEAKADAIMVEAAAVRHWVDVEKEHVETDTLLDGQRAQV